MSGALAASLALRDGGRRAEASPRPSAAATSASPSTVVSPTPAASPSGPAAVAPDPDGVLFSFEDGTEAWGPAAWEGPLGTVRQTDEFRTEAAYGLRIDATKGGWFGLVLATPLDLSGRTALTMDVATAGAPVWNMIAVKTGPRGVWCQTSLRMLPPTTTTTVRMTLPTAPCTATSLPDVRDVYVYFGSRGRYDLDAVRAL